MSAPSITVAICTRNRPELLRRLLGSLLPQLAAPHDLLVIDNAPSNSTTRDLVRSEFPAAVYVVEHAQGLDFARNRALRKAAPMSSLTSTTMRSRARLDRADRSGVCRIRGDRDRTGKVDALSLDSAGAAPVRGQRRLRTRRPQDPPAAWSGIATARRVAPADRLVDCGRQRRESRDP
jgi:hypothetical protein